ncbi:MAG: hypothetical protein WCA32_05465, partial [Chromatiaceae bacterium]
RDLCARANLARSGWSASSTVDRARVARIGADTSRGRSAASAGASGPASDRSQFVGGGPALDILRRAEARDAA